MRGEAMAVGREGGQGCRLAWLQSVRLEGMGHIAEVEDGCGGCLGGQGSGGIGERLNANVCVKLKLSIALLHAQHMQPDRRYRRIGTRGIEDCQPLYLAKSAYMFCTSLRDDGP